MEPERTLKHPPLPRVEQGVLLAFVCPNCFLFSSKYTTACGCYACTFCHHHVPIPVFGAAAAITSLLVNHPSPQ